MLYPIQNNYRMLIDLTGMWKFKPDPKNEGLSENWQNGFDSRQEIALPGSWNEQLEEEGLLYYVGCAWYAKDVLIPEIFKDKKIKIRIGSADYSSQLWIDGKFAGANSLGFLPYEFEINDFITFGKKSQIVIKVSNELDNESIPQGISSEHFMIEKRLREETNPPARFDFSPFGGIHRPVSIIICPENHIDKIKVDTKVLSSAKGSVDLNIETAGSPDGTVAVSLMNNGKEITAEGVLKKNKANIKFEINRCKLWSNENPDLYDLTVRLKNGQNTIDEYTLPIGIREVKIENNKLLLNGKEVYLKGFGKHEDYPIVGKGLLLPVMVKDFTLLKWINANSIRTSHYPYSEEFLRLADKKGILMIDEVPAVSLDFRYVNENSGKNHKEYITRLMERDYNHPSVIMWAVGNEPNLVGEDSYYNGSGKKYWGDIFSFARKLDKSRPITVPNCTRAGVDDPVFQFCDVISLNRYYGWYEFPGKLERAAEVLSGEMDEIYRKYKKPVLFTEFGADTIPGLHSTSDQMFTEEYQAKLLETYIEVIRSKSYSIGEQVWNFADFRTPQHFRRVVLNMKGVFTRERQPKLAAFKLKEIWAKPVKTKRGRK
jgi:beta-glucuronidase